jgi:hypothetical protein
LDRYATSKCHGYACDERMVVVHVVLGCLSQSAAAAGVHPPSACCHAYSANPENFTRIISKFAKGQDVSCSVLSIAASGQGQECPCSVLSIAALLTVP